MKKRTELSPDASRSASPFRSNHTYLVVALIVVGAGGLVSSSLLGFLGFRLAGRVARLEAQLAENETRARERMARVSREILRQQEEMEAVRRVADEDLRAIEEAHGKIARVRDPAVDLAALRGANEDLWRELAQQRVDLLKALREHRSDVSPADTAISRSRFRLGETRFYEPEHEAPSFEGTNRDAEIRRATRAPVPAYLVLELTPESIAIGEPFQLSVRLVNRSNGSITPSSLRLDWSFDGRNTGGGVPIETRKLAPREGAPLYELKGEWTPAHDRGGAVLEATLELARGGRLVNTLSW